jgi:ATP-dependent helicase/DNAse subunit B
VAARAQAAHGAAIESARRAGVPSPYDGRIEAPALRQWLAERYGESYDWSPTQLESLAKCPHAWFAQRLLTLERLEDPDDDVARTVRGRVLHDALARFYEGLVRERGGPVLLRTDELDALRPALEAAFDAAYAAAQATEWMGEPALADARRDEWRRVLGRFVEREALEREKWFATRNWKARRTLRTGVVAHERPFGPLPLEIEGVRLRVRGTIDRIEAGIDARVDDPARYRSIVDYKSSKSACPGHGEGAAWRDGIVLQAPLYAAALEALEPDATIARVEYLNLRDAKSVLPLKVVEVSHKTDAIEWGEEAAGQLAASRAGVAAAVRRAREGEFPAAPKPSAGCPTWCVAFDTCRVAGGPRVKAW